LGALVSLPASVLPPRGATPLTSALTAPPPPLPPALLLVPSLVPQAAANNGMASIATAL
jgi:hypothetical protein